MHPSLPTCASRLSGKFNNGICLHFQLQAVFPSHITPLVRAFIFTNDSPSILFQYLLNYSSFLGSQRRRGRGEAAQGALWGKSLSFLCHLGILGYQPCWFLNQVIYRLISWCKLQGMGWVLMQALTPWSSEKSTHLVRSSPSCCCARGVLQEHISPSPTCLDGCSFYSCR